MFMKIDRLSIIGRTGTTVETGAAKKSGKTGKTGVNFNRSKSKKPKQNKTDAVILYIACACILLPTLLIFPAPATAAALLHLEAPEQVMAGETFTLTPKAREDSLLPANEYAALFESHNGGEPRLVEISIMDGRGTARMQLRRKKAGTYRYNVFAGPFQSEITIAVLPGPPAVVKEVKERLYLGLGGRATVEFALEDEYGNRICAGDKAEKQPENLLAVAITDPAQNLLPETDFELTTNPAGNIAVNFTAEKKGDYLVEARLPHDSSVTARSLVNVQELITVTAIEPAVLDGRELFLCISEDRAQPGRLELETILHGENNITKTPSPAEAQNIVFHTEQPNLISIEKTAGGGAILTEMGRSGPASITVTYLEGGKKLQKTLPLWIAGKAVQIELETKTSGLTAQVEATLLDGEGQPTWEKIKNYRLDLPADLKLVAQTPFTRGKTKFILEAERYGSYNIGFTAGDELHRHLRIDLIEEIRPARHVVIFIGQESYIRDGQPAKMSPAPEIYHGRVFVPLDFLTATFGVEISPSPDDKSIALQSPDGTEMIIDREAGQLTITNTKNDTAVTTPIDTLFLQETIDGYILPAGIITSFLGAGMDYFPKYNQIEHITFIQK